VVAPTPVVVKGSDRSAQITCEVDALPPAQVKKMTDLLKLIVRWMLCQMLRWENDKSAQITCEVDALPPAQVRKMTDLLKFPAWCGCSLYQVRWDNRQICLKRTVSQKMRGTLMNYDTPTTFQVHDKYSEKNCADFPSFVLDIPLQNCYDTFCRCCNAIYRIIPWNAYTTA